MNMVVPIILALFISCCYFAAILAWNSIKHDVDHDKMIEESYKNIKHFDIDPLTQSSVTRKPSKQEFLDMMNNKVSITTNVLNYFRYLDGVEPYFPHSSFNHMLEISRMMHYYHKEGFIDTLED